MGYCRCNEKCGVRDPASPIPAAIFGAPLEQVLPSNNGCAGAAARRDFGFLKFFTLCAGLLRSISKPRVSVVEAASKNASALGLSSALAAEETKPVSHASVETETKCRQGNMAFRMQ